MQWQHTAILHHQQLLTGTDSAEQQYRPADTVMQEPHSWASYMLPYNIYSGA